MRPRDAYNYNNNIHDFNNSNRPDPPTTSPASRAQEHGHRTRDPPERQPTAEGPPTFAHACIQTDSIGQCDPSTGSPEAVHPGGPITTRPQPAQPDDETSQALTVARERQQENRTATQSHYTPPDDDTLRALSIALLRGDEDTHRNIIARLGLATPPTTIHEPHSKQWTWTDTSSTRFRTTRHGGPRWEHVTRRVTHSLATGAILEDVLIGQEPSTSAWLHRPLPHNITGTKTVLFHTDPDITPAPRGGSDDEAEDIIPPLSRRSDSSSEEDTDSDSTEPLDDNCPSSDDSCTIPPLRQCDSSSDDSGDERGPIVRRRRTFKPLSDDDSSDSDDSDVMPPL